MEETIKKENTTNKAISLIVFIIQRLVTIAALIVGIILMFPPFSNYIDGVIFIMLWGIMSSINSLTDSFHKFSEAVCSALSAIMTFQRVTNENKTNHPLPNLRDIISNMANNKEIGGIELHMSDENGQPLSPEIIEEMKRNDPFFKMISKMKEDLESNPALKDIIERRIKKESISGKETTDYKLQSKDGLDKMLKDAITKEDYELAAVIQEEIKKRGI